METMLKRGRFWMLMAFCLVLLLGGVVWGTYDWLHSKPQSATPLFFATEIKGTKFGQNYTTFIDGKDTTRVYFMHDHTDRASHIKGGK